MKLKICTVVTGNNLKEFLLNLEKVQKVSEMVELRVDYIQNLKIQDIQTIKNKTRKKSIFTCRKRDEGGKFKGEEIQRIKILSKASQLDFDYIDIELSSILQFNVLEHCNKHKLIISYHNFEKTPSESFLNLLIKRVKKFNPDIVKITTQINNESDIVKLCKLIVNKEMDEKRIIIGMGEKGKVTRIVGPLLGSYLTYVSVDKNKSILGQLSFSELKSIYTKLNVFNI